MERIFDLLPYIKSQYNTDNVLAGKYGGKWIAYSIDEYINLSNYVSYALLALGIKKGDKIASISVNRPEINFLEIGALQIGAVHIPIYPTISESDYKYILSHSDAKFLFFSGEDIYKRIEHILPELKNIKHIYTLSKINSFETFADIIAYGKNNPNPILLEKLKSEIKSTDLALIIYTSGTTGNPKGVMLSHYNIISNVKACSHIPQGLGPGSRALSFLPMCHAYEKMMTYLYQNLGISIFYSENLANISENIKEIKPDIMTTVPRFIDKIYYKIITSGRKLPQPKRAIYYFAINLALKFKLNHKNGRFYDFKLKIADKLVYNKIRESLGGNLKLIVSGGAALQPIYSKLFWAMGFNLMEGYGMTETSPVISVYNYEPGGMKFGTVGVPINGVSVKIAEDGEILCKGPNVMLGYYNDEEQTKQIIDEAGWLHTGDIGHIEDGKLLRITGRKKDLFKTSHGKYIVPQVIENKFRESPFIDNIMVIGENQKFPAALIVPDFNDLRSWCMNKNIFYTTNNEMINLRRIRQRFRKEIDYYNKFLGEEEQIRKFELIDHEWTVLSGELTPTLKLKRNIIARNYKNLIEKIYR